MTPSHGRSPLTEQEIRSCTVGDLQPLSDKIQIVDYDPLWPEIFRCEANRIREALGGRASGLEHIGSTSVPGLAAKPIVDMVLLVADSAAEETYVPILESIGFLLDIRESNWYEHRMLKRRDPAINLHVFSSGCPEVNCMLLFRDWLRNNVADRDLYANSKLRLAKQEWKYVQNYADAKTSIIEQILARARSR